MSMFLGFIHHLMYGKIQFQENLVNVVLNMAEEKGLVEVREEVNKLGVPENGALEDIIDTSNIHGWLQERVELVENRFAKSVNLLLENDNNIKPELLDKMYNLGLSESFKGNALEAYQILSQKFLDGMPCDGSLVPLLNEPYDVKIKVVTDLHSPVWERYGNKEFYWELRNSYTKGFLSNSGLELIVDSDKSFEIK